MECIIGILLKDWHREYIQKQITYTQHHDIVWAVQQRLQDVFVIAEDSNIYEGNDELTKALLSQMPPAKILA